MPEPASQMRKSVDIVLLVLDTQRADRLSCYGYDRPTTPALDALAAGATRFAHAVAPAQWTVPTHASLFSGLYPSQHTMHQMNSVLPRPLSTLAERLSAAGYFTAGFSQNPLVGLVKNDLDRGFARFESYHLLGNILLTTRLNRPDESHAVRKRLELGLRWMLAEAVGYSHETPLQHLAPVLAPIWQRLLQIQGRSKIAGTARLLAAASDLLLGREGCRDGQPIFVFINLMGAHVPYDPDRRLLRRFLPTEHDARQTGALLRWANQLQIDVHNWVDRPLPSSQQAMLNAIYDAEVATQDEQVGAFLQRLREAGRLEQTFLAVVADHGDHLGDKDRVNHAFGVYQSLVHVPLILRDPIGHLASGEVRRDPVSSRRVFHTLLSAAGAASADEEALSLAHGDDPVPPGRAVPVFSEGYPLEWAIGRLQTEKARHAALQGHTETVRAVREGRHKLIVASDRRQLFDVQEDAAETKDLQAALPQRVQELQEELQRFVARSRPVAGAQTHDEDDPQVLRQLRELGYLD